MGRTIPRSGVAWCVPLSRKTLAQQSRNPTESATALCGSGPGSGGGSDHESDHGSDHGSDQPTRLKIADSVPAVPHAGVRASSSNPTESCRAAKTLMVSSTEGSRFRPRASARVDLREPSYVVRVDQAVGYGFDDLDRCICDGLSVAEVGRIEREHQRLRWLTLGCTDTPFENDLGSRRRRR